VGGRSSSPDEQPATLAAENERLKAKLDEIETDVARLRDSERMYRLSAKISGRLIWTADAQGKLTTLGLPFEAMTGVPEERAIREGWLNLVHPEDQAETQSSWREAVRAGADYEGEFRVRWADGSYRLMRSRAAPLYGEGGQISRWAGTIEDIHEEREAERVRLETEERLRESEELYRYTLELGRHIVFTADPKGAFLTMSSRFTDMTGGAADTPPEELMHPADVDDVMTAWMHAVATGEPHLAEFRMRVLDGSYRMFRSRAAPRRDAQGRIIRWYGFTEDIHDQRQAEVAQHDAEQRYRLAIQATNDAVWDFDLIGGLIDWSDNASAIFGSPDTPLGRTSADWWEERIHPDDRQAVTKSFYETIEGKGRRWSATYRFQREDGSYADIFDRGFIIRAVDGEAIRAVGAMADLTERHRAEAEIRRMQAELIHVSRVSAMGTMASTLAHELNQPLTALGNFISGAKRLAEREGTGSSPLAEALNAAEEGALRAGEIVRRLRELVSHGTVSVIVEHLPKLIADASVLAFVDAQALGVRHRLELDPAAKWVRVDRIQIQQVLINLIRNAVEAMEGAVDREVVISTRTADGDMVEVAVEDTGGGIAPEHIDSLFSQFMTTKSGGMGIGLPISRTIVEAHGGHIWGGNRPGGGAVFRFTLPRAKPGDRKPPEL
jgi:two-component system sensor kinase FixL